MKSTWYLGATCTLHLRESGINLIGRNRYYMASKLGQSCRPSQFNLGTKVRSRCWCEELGAGASHHHFSTPLYLNSLVPRPPLFLPSVYIHNNTQEWTQTESKKGGGLGTRLIAEYYNCVACDLSIRQCMFMDMYLCFSPSKLMQVIEQ